MAQQGILRSGKYVAKAASAKAASALKEPLLPPGTVPKASRMTDSLSSSEGDSDGDSEATSVQSESASSPPPPISARDMAISALVGVVAAAGVAASAGAVIAAQSVAVIVMGGLCVVQSPAAVVNQVRMARVKSYRASIASIRGNIRMLEDEVDFMQSSVDELQIETDELKSIEGALASIAGEQEVNVNEIVELVNENEELLKTMRRNLREIFVASMAKIVMRSDTDGDMKIDKREIPLLALRLKIHLDSFGITLDTEKFQQMLHENNDIQNVLMFCGEVLFDSEDDEEGDDDDESAATFDFEAFCRGLDDEAEGDQLPQRPKMTKKDRMSMMSVKRQYSGGSVDVARGKRMTLVASASRREVKRKTVVKEVKRRQTKMRMYGEQRAGGMRLGGKGGTRRLRPSDVGEVVAVSNRSKRNKAYELLGHDM